MMYKEKFMGVLAQYSKKDANMVKSMTGVLLAIAHVTATKDRSLSTKINGATADEVDVAYKQLSYDKELMGGKLTRNEIIRYVARMFIGGEVCFADETNPMGGIRLTTLGMLTAAEMFENFKPYEVSAVYEFINKSEFGVQNIANN